MIHFRSHFSQFLPNSFRVLIHSQQTWMHFFTGHWLWECFGFKGKNGIMVVWVLKLNFDSKSSEMRSGKPLGGLVETIRSLWSCSWDREHFLTVPVQTLTDIRKVDLPSLRVSWSLFHIFEWCILFPLDHRPDEWFVVTFYFGECRVDEPLVMNLSESIISPWVQSWG